MNPILRLASRWSRPVLCLALAHLSACIADTSSPPGLDPDDDCVEVTTCDAGDDCVPSVVCDGDATARPRYHTPPCTEGATRPCTIFLAEHNGVTDCMPGVERCSGGVWGEVCEAADQPVNPAANAPSGAR